MAILRGVKYLVGTSVTTVTLAAADAIAVGVYSGQIQGTAQIAIQAITAGADVAPTLNIYGSNDNVNWDIYDIDGTNTFVTLETAGSKSIIRDSFPHEYIAVNINKLTGTTGTIKVSIDVKEQTTV